MKIAGVRAWIGVVGCVAALGLAGAALGQATRPEGAVVRPAPEITFDSDEEAYAALASYQWAIRDAAQRYLMKLPAEDREAVEKALMKTTDPEVEARLYAVALHLFLKADTPFAGEVGLLGVSLNPEVQEEQDGKATVVIAITSLQPGFPAAEVLQVGDRIFAMNGTKFNDETSIDSFRTAVNLNKPGTTVKLSIERAGAMRDVRVKLAGVPEAGTAALMDFINDRNAKAAAYRMMLHAKKDGVPVTSAGVPRGLPGE